MIPLAGTVAELFFLQAEDGIRALYVTGVQTCPLPISHRRGPRSRRAAHPHVDREADGRPAVSWARVDGWARVDFAAAVTRSEERRVGKEWRARGTQLA